MATSVLSKYLGHSHCAMDVWEETKHHRADNGRFTSGSGRGKFKENDDDKNDGKKGKMDEKDGNNGREEMSEEKATRIVRSAFKEAKCELNGLKLVEHHLRADVKEADDGSLQEINKYLTKRGLKAEIQDKTAYKIAEDGFDDIQVVDDPMLEILVDLCRIDMLSKDLHYRAQGKAFYGIHELADLVHDIGDASDDLNEVYYMGEKQEDPPERSFVAAKAAELVGKPGEMDELLKKLYDACNEAAKAVETAKAKGVTGGTSSVLDDISKKSLQAKGLLMRTIKNGEGRKAIDAVIAKGIYFKPDAEATDSGTSEGAKKGWEHRRHGGMVSYIPLQPNKMNDSKDRVYLENHLKELSKNYNSLRDPNYVGASAEQKGFQDCVRAMGYELTGGHLYKRDRERNTDPAGTINPDHSIAYTNWIINNNPKNPKYGINALQRYIDDNYNTDKNGESNRWKQSEIKGVKLFLKTIGREDLGKSITHHPSFDSGTSEGAKRGWETRKNGAGYYDVSNPADSRVLGHHNTTPNEINEFADAITTAHGSDSRAFSNLRQSLHNFFNGSKMDDFNKDDIYHFESIVGKGHPVVEAIKSYKKAQDAGTSEGAKKGWEKRKGSFSVNNLNSEYGRLADDIDSVAEKYPFYPIRAQMKKGNLDLEHGGGESISHPQYGDAVKAIHGVIKKHSGYRPGGLYETESFGSSYKHIPFHSRYTMLKEGDRVFPKSSDPDEPVGEPTDAAATFADRVDREAGAGAPSFQRRF